MPFLLFEIKADTDFKRRNKQIQQITTHFFYLGASTLQNKFYGLKTRQNFSHLGIKNSLQKCQ